MDLKELLGEELYNQVIEKAGDNKIAVVSDGNWFPKDKFDEKNNEVKELKGQLKERDKQLEDLGAKAKGNEELVKQINDLKEQNERTTKEYQEKLDKQAFEFALDKAITEAQARNPKAVKALLNTETIKLDGEKLLGFDEQIKVIRESDGYLFDSPGLKGRVPHNPPNPRDKTTVNPFSKEHFNLTEQGRIYKEDRELAIRLAAEHGIKLN
ncbi:phage scaffolding protein [Aneurinibacillus migulanus]|uniref:Phage minor structural protein GP20 n=1 Tax=Aneurinibacillus migulanus TaxID=47500 RepID=A0A0D1XTF6_ANEMI|nr:phage scaffolding protein [Aneurinibacillus migulanus]KIV57506.1 scaffolding protein [Aneurinibacillus migulanus]KON94880.1 scaffolding protein [Aneurinibacillus migulanus]MED0892853.1 phage scaffolding protein [Aneurinibacillus migulanus]MED1619099.1 phage scaffolding protein [Aneurinibacillus migulanus]SDI92565.1 Phage minor structural protein GP20 [Aneurinibacillus migulanus]